jgi:hypothetical protein
VQTQNNSAALSVTKTVNAATPLVAGLESVFPFLCFLKNGAKFVYNKNWRNLDMTVQQTAAFPVYNVLVRIFIEQRPFALDELYEYSALIHAVDESLEPCNTRRMPFTGQVEFECGELIARKRH